MLERVVARSRTQAQSVCGALGRAAERWLAGRGGVVGIGAALVMSALAAIGLALHLSDTTNVASFLAGQDVSLAVGAWRDQGVWPLALAYLVVDAIVFVPAYALLLIAVAHRIAALEQEDRARRAMACVATLATLAALLADEIENVLGIAALFDAVAPAYVRVIATRAKFAFVGLATAVIVTLALAWFFAFGSYATSINARIDRARMRAGVVDVVWRNRYTLCGLVVFAGLLLLMDQSRDVLVGIAQAWQSSQAPGAALVMAISAVAVWSVAYTSWMWSRILGRVRRAAWSAKVAAAQMPATPLPAEKEEAVVPLPGEIADQPPSQTWPPGVFHFARWFARIVGAAPVLMLVWLCGSAAGDAARAGATLSAYLLLLFAALSLAGAMLFLWRRADAGAAVELHDYYEGTAPDADVRDELTSPRYRFLSIPHAPLTLPLMALVSLAALRLVNIVFPQLPSVAFTVICLSATLWLGVLGLLSKIALRQGRPYPLALLVAVMLLGWGGCTDNHVVWAPPGAHDEGAWARYGMWTFHASIAAIAIIAGWLGYRLRLRGFKATMLAVAFVGVVLATLAIADRSLPRSLAGRTVAEPVSRPDLTAALEQWLASLCKPGTRCANGVDEQVPVYFVSTEGGGIRAAYWTALILAQISERIPDFASRTFSISGVSGGAIGAAVYRSCTRESPETTAIACIQRFGRADVLTPLVSAWMFEDVLGRFIPTSHCATPGCGILTRGAWFEQALERAAPGLKAVLRPESGDRATPYLILNATWVETGERAIASDLAIASSDFPTARDQIAILGHDLTLSSAAHNAARFPFINAIGTVRSRVNDACPAEEREEEAFDSQRVCGHVADGGYFDNSGGYSTADVLRALATVLQQPRFGTLAPAHAAWHRRNLVPQVIMIRNGLEARKIRIESREQATSEEHLRCNTDDPSLPRCKGRFWLLTDLLGPAVTAFNAIGTGANGRLAESLLHHVVAAGRFDLAATTTQPPVVTFDLRTQDVLYPLGWYLSARARTCMEVNAARNLRYRELCRPEDGECVLHATRAAPRETADDRCFAE